MKELEALLVKKIDERSRLNMEIFSITESLKLLRETDNTN